ncbi:MAG: cardiolipin synthase [Planctomycetes bacterium]|nr:cardiolipin synthase [Planctomycetota bacterium]
MITWTALGILSHWLICAGMMIVVPQQRSAGAARSWLLLVFLLPWVGVLVYLLIGRARLPALRQERQARVSDFIRSAVELRASVVPHPPAGRADAIALTRRLGDFPLTAGNRCELLTAYQGIIDRLCADIDAATHHVHLSYYIIAADRTARQVADALVRAAGRGVACRVLMDGSGSKRGLHHLAPRLRAAGIEVMALLATGLLRRGAARFDLRNHRKIAIIDGRIGYTGSQNLIDPDAVRGLVYQELVVRLAGPAVRQLQAVLLADRYLECGQELPLHELLPEMPETGGTLLQTLPSGPGYRHANTLDLLVSLIHGARRRVVITTPYFVPTESLLDALIIAALRGVAVVLIVAAQIDQTLVGLAQRSYYDQLLVSGIAIHAYRPRFLHAKHVTIDDDLALIGTSNMDIRSFALNAEISLVIPDPAVVADLRRIEDGYLAEAEQLDLARWRKRPAALRIAQNLARLMDAVL